MSSPTEEIYFKESSKGDTFIERDFCADGFVANVWVNGSRIAKIVIDPKTSEVFLENY